MCRWQATPLEDAIRAQDRILVNLLKSKGAVVSGQFQWGTIFRAASAGDIKLLSLLTDSGSDLALVNYDKARPRSPRTLSLADT